MNSTTEAVVDATISAAEAALVKDHPAAPVVMSAREVASAYRKWAIAKNICPTLPAAVEQAILADVPAAILSDPQETSLRIKGISSIAFSDEEKKVFVYTKRKVTKADAQLLPNSINGCHIVYPRGQVDELGETPAEAQTASYAVIQSNGANFYSCGSSVSPGNAVSAGTMGALVRDAAGTIFGLSNNHVTGLCSHSQPGLPILAPGVYDVEAGGLNPFTIGTHSKALPMGVGSQGNVDIFLNKDAAIFKIAELGAVSSMQRDVYDTPATVEAPALGMEVEKVGRTTGHTKGKIIGVELMPLKVAVSAESQGFRGQVFFADAWIVHGETDLFSDNGDSGSLVVHRKIDGALSAVGLIFAGGQDSGAPGGKKSYFSPLQPILDALGVTLVHGFNV